MTDWQLGLQAFHEGRMREAADRLQTALAETELTISGLARYETYAYLGAALYALGLSPEAVTAFEMAFQFSPAAVPSDDLMMNLAHAYLAVGRREAAREALRFLLAQAPGHVAATMLAARLSSSLSSGSAISGAILGASPETVENYIRTLRFSHSASGGYPPAEVHEALSQLRRFILSLTESLQEAETRNAQYELEILRYRQMEDAVVENMMQSIPQEQPAQAKSDEAKSDKVDSKLSPIEILFRQKSS